MLMDLSIVFRRRGSSKTLMNTLAVSGLWSIPGEKCQNYYPGSTHKGTGCLLPLILVSSPPHRQ